MAFLKERFNSFIVNQALKVGVEPVKNLVGEDERLNELNRLDIVDKDVSDDRNLNNNLLVFHHILHNV